MFDTNLLVSQCYCLSLACILSWLLPQKGKQIEIEISDCIQKLVFTEIVHRRRFFCTKIRILISMMTLVIDL